MGDLLSYSGRNMVFEVDNIVVSRFEKFEGEIQLSDIFVHSAREISDRRAVP